MSDILNETLILKLNALKAGDGVNTGGITCFKSKEVMIR